MQLRKLYSALRTPLIVVAGLFLLATNHALIRIIVLLQSHNNAFHTFLCAAPSQHDCFLYVPTTLLSVPNIVKFLGYLIVLIVVLEQAQVLLPRKQTLRRDVFVALVALGFAAAPWLVLLHVEGMRMRLFPLLSLYTALVWVFIVSNAGLGVVERFIGRNRWITHLLEFTFPISDIVFFKFHRKRIGNKAGLLRFVPVASYLAILVVIMGVQLKILTGSTKAEILPVRVFDPHALVYDTGGFWYSDTITTAAGLWHYDSQSGKAEPFMRALDLRSFWLEDDYLYFHDRFDSVLRKVHSGDRKVAWRIQVPREAFVFELSMKDGLLVALGSGGYLSLIDADGEQKVERTFSYETRHPQVLPEGRIAFVSPRQMLVRIAGVDPEDDEVIPLPLSDGRFALMSADLEADGIPILTGTVYAERQQILHVATLWGEIFRYDFQAGRWLDSYWTMPGIRAIAADEERGLLFVYNHVQGYVDMVDLTSGRRLTSIVATVFGNSIMVDADQQLIIVSAHGPGATSLPAPGGFYQFSYESILASNLSAIARR